MTVLPKLIVNGRTIWIQSRTDATITGFSCEFSNGGVLRLQNAIIDNSAYDVSAIIVSYDSETTLLLSGSNHIIGKVASNSQIIQLSASLTIDKVPGGSDMDSTLILTDAEVPVLGLGYGFLQVKGGTFESHGSVTGIVADRGVLVTGGNWSRRAIPALCRTLLFTRNS